MKFLILGTLTALLCFYAYTQDNQQSKSYQNDLDDQQIQLDIAQQLVEQGGQKKNKNQTSNHQVLNRNHVIKQDLSKNVNFNQENQQKKERIVNQRRSSSAPKEIKNMKKINGSAENTNKQKQIKRLSLSLQSGSIKNGIKTPVNIKVKDNKKNQKLNEKAQQTVTKNNRKIKNERTNTIGKDKNQLYQNQNKGSNNKYERLNLNILKGKKNSKKINNKNRKNQKYETAI